MMTNAPSIEAVLEAFFADVAVGRGAGTRVRYWRVYIQLNRYLESDDAGRLLGTDYNRLLAAEREFRPDRALARLFSAEGLVLCLSGFVDDAWLLPAPVDARSQISLTDRLLRWVQGRHLIDMSSCSCAVYECEEAIRRARKILRSQVEPPRLL
ncbi:hypothetical protein LWF01_18980 [Saxibacter everestensis]|uniref:Uncharacterized protein n=1 Tax=Saxibacter everestensis TaxID=2909229 RepID=A0ABY8QSY0_9MICO|nr:hypothetical protein LWF01_18980 [Brevibacteriaceae bacterium ZFBP1038]